MDFSCTCIVKAHISRTIKGYATTIMAREGLSATLDLLLRVGAGPEAIEEALLKACLFGQVKL